MKNNMRLNYSLVFIAGLFVGLCSSRVIFTKNSEVKIISSQGKVSSEIVQLLSLTGIEHDGSLDSIIKETQASWLRKPGQERWDIVEQNWEQRAAIFNVFKKIGLLDEVKPKHLQYDYTLLMGALLSRVQTRLQSLIDVWNDGVRFNYIIILSGARPLIDEELQAYQVSFSGTLPTTETEMMKSVYEQTAMPEEMRQIPLIIIDVPMLKNQDGTLRRPSTGDTVDLWLQSNPVPGSCLVVSNQPYILYQDSVTKCLLPDLFSVETFGQEDQNSSIGVHLDNLARCLYQEKKRLNL